jgi:hypothetical protein
MPASIKIPEKSAAKAEGIAEASKNKTDIETETKTDTETPGFMGNEKESSKD